MTCPTCPHADKPRATLVDGRQVCTWCPEWQHECEARYILNLPSLSRRRAFLYGTPNQWGKLAGGVQQRRGDAALKRLEATMLALWRARAAMVANDNADSSSTSAHQG